MTILFFYRPAERELYLLSPLSFLCALTDFLNYESLESAFWKYSTLLLLSIDGFF